MYFIYIAPKALFVNHLYSAPPQGRLRVLDLTHMTFSLSPHLGTKLSQFANQSDIVRYNQGRQDLTRVQESDNILGPPGF